MRLTPKRGKNVNFRRPLDITQPERPLSVISSSAERPGTIVSEDMVPLVLTRDCTMQSMDYAK